MDSGLAPKVFIVTGGSSGIGLAVARRLTRAGAAVVIGARRAGVGEQVAADLRAEGGRAIFARADVSVEADAAHLVEVATGEYGRLDGAFNNAGSIEAVGELSSVDAADWAAELNANLTSVFYSLKYQLPEVIKTRGSIVNNASNMGAVALPAMGAYVAAKHGVVGLTKAAALEVADRGVRVNAINTGGVDTPLGRSSAGSEEALAAIAAMHPVNRLATPEEIAPMVTFLLGDESTFVTGAALAIDGGFTTR
ncbi:SDR family oxidoreductase [Nocardia panacis]|uniref:SDR family oxidoreductase n=1 Tax=Nocardia panacis TaxID=2340916 RepID=A0A3A4KEP2_9NOCA|nr:SDR family oxidoreductase [Nocardia panacis]RJO70929.1 SDR family oxidoreductase [Nocardia panacis]